MSIKENVLKRLIESDDFISGQTLAYELNVSRGAIWKSIKSLKENGYEIESVTNKGYRYISDNDVLSADEILKYTGDFKNLVNINIFDSVSSTNTVLKEMADNHCNEFTIVAADYQTSGKAKSGKNFYSPKKTGVYFSVLLRPDFDMSMALKLSCISAVAVCKSIESVTSFNNTSIKWINDIFFNNKKIAGILTEASTDIETEDINYVIIGIGINLKTETFPNDVSSNIGSLNCSISRNRLIGEVIHHLLSLYSSLPNTEFITYYKDKSFIEGHKIKFKKNKVTYTGTAIGIDNECHLLVDINGNTISLNSGEVTIIDY